MIEAYPIKSIICILIISLFPIYGCQTAPMMGGEIRAAQLTDGVYDGEYRKGPNKAVVRVKIEQRRIVTIDLISHFASWKGHKADTLIPQRIIANQSTRVDAVSGATNSSRVIMNAVQNAVDKSCSPD